MARKRAEPRSFDEGVEPAADAEPSRSARKRESHGLRRLGADLVELRAERLAALPLPERLREAVAEARRLTSFGARRRQVQFIGKLMRRLDEDVVVAIRSELEK
jgi:ribosome-associated protein